VTALVLAAAAGLAACTSGAASTPAAPVTALPTTPASAAQRLSETGSSLMAPLFSLWGPAYHAQFSQVRIGTATSSSGEGITSAAAGSTDIGTSDAYLSPADVTKYTNLVNIPLAVAALMVICHVPGVGPAVHLKLNGTVLAKIFAGQVSPTRAQDLRAFLNWAFSTGTAQLAQVNFQPLPPSVVTLSQAQIARIKG